MNAFKIYFNVTLTMLLWASAFVGIRIGLEDYSPGSLALLRFLTASLCMGCIYVCLPVKKPVSWKIRGELMIIGVAAIGIYHLCLNYGEVTVSAGIASFIIGLIPVITILCSLVFLNERPNRLVWLGIGLSFLGLLLMVLAERTQAAVSGVLIILISAVMGGVYNITQKRYLRDFHPVVVTAWVIWGATLMLLIFISDLIQEIPQANAQSTLAAIYLGIFPAAIAYVTWCYVLNHWSASKASIFLYTLPILSTLMGYMVLHERPTLLSLAGGSLALVGALAANRFQEIESSPSLPDPGTMPEMAAER